MVSYSYPKFCIAFILGLEDLHVWSLPLILPRYGHVILFN